MTRSTRPPEDFHIATDDARQTLVLTRDVLTNLLQHKQLGSADPEAGGMLFAQIERGWITIRLASGPHDADRRHRLSYEPDLRQQQREIERQFKQGLHFVGEWHTHPEARPQPSGVDLNSMARCFTGSRHSLRAFVMVIVGTARWPDCLWVSLHRENTIVRLWPSKPSAPGTWLGMNWLKSAAAVPNRLVRNSRIGFSVTEAGKTICLGDQ